MYGLAPRTGDEEDDAAPDPSSLMQRRWRKA
jgi:hypothetical protein